MRDNPKLFLWPNRAGMGWAGTPKLVAGEQIIANPRPIRFGIPEHGGGPDLLGAVQYDGWFLAVALELKTGAGRLSAKQRDFKFFFENHQGIYVLAHESELALSGYLLDIHPTYLPIIAPKRI